MSKSFSLFTLALLGCCASTILALTEQYDDWKQDHYVVYAKNDEQPLGPARTLELLEKLQNLYRGREDAGSKGRLSRVTDLIETSRVSVDKCYPRYLATLWQMVNKHQFYTVNVMPYLALHAKQQLSVCKDLDMYSSIRVANLGIVSEKIKDILESLNISFNTEYGPEPFDDWKEDHYKVYQSESSESGQEPLGHEKTLELLEKLQSLYRNRADSGSLARLVRVTGLIGASKVSPQKCDKDSLASMDKLIARHISYQVNIIPYLQHYKQKQLDLC